VLVPAMVQRPYPHLHQHQHQHTQHRHQHQHQLLEAVWVGIGWLSA
jgi:hypothetical protein